MNDTHFEILVHALVDGSLTRRGLAFITDFGNERMVVLDRGEFGSEGSGEGQVREPTGLAIGPNRKVVVADFRTNRIQLLSLTGKFIRAFGGTGSAPGQFNGPTGIAVGQGNIIFVVDKGNDRVQAFPARTGSGTLSAAARSEQRRQHEDDAERKAKSERTSHRARRTGGNRSRR